MPGMVPLALPLLLLAAAAQEGKAAPAPKPADPREKEFTYYLSRARELATQAASTGDHRVGQEAFDSFLAASRIRPKDPVPLAEAGLLAVETGDGGTAVRMLNAVFSVALLLREPSGNERSQLAKLTLGAPEAVLAVLGDPTSSAS